MKKQVLKRMLRYAKPYRGCFAGGCICALFYVLFTLLGPVFIGNAVDCILGTQAVDFAGVAKWLMLLCVSILLAAASQREMNICTRKLSAAVSNDMRSDAFCAISHTPLSYIDSHSHGDLISRLVNDADLVSDGLLQGLTQLLPGIATILGTLVVMAVLNPLIALVVVLVTPLSIAFAGFVAKRTTGFFRAQSAAQGRMSGFVNETVSGQDVIRAFGSEENCFKEFDKISDELYETGLKSVFYSSVTNPGTRFVNSIVYAAVGVIGAVSAVNGRMSVGLLSCFLTYANQYTKPFNEVTGVLAQMQAAMTSAERILQVIEESPAEQELQDALQPETCAGNVKIENVYFSYTPAVRLIENFNLEVKPGQRIAIVGKTGCGKTTLINLLMRFYDTDAGTISVDGTDIKTMKRSALRGMYGMVLQETWLKSASVRDNIAYGRPDASESEIKAAAKAAHADSFIRRLPQGYDTVITPGGGNLSAGQKQLLCIARIMLSRPQMLILDEATSNIDTRTEMLVQKAFETLMKGRTSFIVAHRLSTIESADLILVMDSGHIVEQGTHQQLLEKNGAYAALYHSQLAVQ